MKVEVKNISKQLCLIKHCLKIPSERVKYERIVTLQIQSVYKYKYKL